MAAQIEPLEDRPGTELVPGYRLLARVGAGGAGEVWSAEGPGGLRVALKIVRLAGGLGRREVANLRILRAIRHPNLLAYFGAWRHRDRLIIGMELADGSLWDRLQASRRRGLAGIPRGELMKVMVEVARVLDFLNEPCHQLDGRSGVAIHHRDIKPQNIMLIGRGVKVADFGLSCLDDPVGGITSASQAGLTFAYAAPEAFRRRVSVATDQYSLAVTYCHLRGGRLPFTGPPAAVMMGHLCGDPDLSMLPEKERPILARAMAKEPERRWPDCRSLIQAIIDRQEAGVPDSIPDEAGSFGESVDASPSVEVPAPSGPGPQSSYCAGSDECEDGPVDDSAYCLDGPAPADSGSISEEASDATGWATVVLDEFPIIEARGRRRRLGWAAVPIVAAMVVAWSCSERIAIRAAIPEAGGPMSPAAPALHPAAVTRRGAEPTRAAARAADPYPMSRSAASPPARPSSDDAGRMLATWMRTLAAQRLAAVSVCWSRIQRTASRLRLLVPGATSPRSPSETRSMPPVQPEPPHPGPIAAPGLQIGHNDLLEIESGRNVEIPIHVDRGGNREGLSVHFDDLPPGVTIADATIPPGHDHAVALAMARLDAPAATAMIRMTMQSGAARADARLRIRVRDNPAMLSRTRGHTLLACGRPSEAVAAFTEAIRAGVVDPRVYHNRGLAYASLNQIDAAIRDYTEAVRLAPSDASIRYDRGLAYARRSDDFRALLDLDSAIHLDPGCIRAYQARAAIYLKHGDLARSRADSGRAGELDRAARPGGQPPSPRPRS